MKAYIQKRLLPLKYIKLLVFDEADEMLKMGGFRDESERLYKNIRRATNGQVQVSLPQLGPLGRG